MPIDTPVDVGIRIYRQDVLCVKLSIETMPHLHMTMHHMTVHIWLRVCPYKATTGCQPRRPCAAKGVAAHIWKAGRGKVVPAVL